MRTQSRSRLGQEGKTGSRQLRSVGLVAAFTPLGRRFQQLSADSRLDLGDMGQHGLPGKAETRSAPCCACP